MLFCSTSVLGDIHTYSQPLQLNDKWQPMETKHGNSVTCLHLPISGTWLSLCQKKHKKEVDFEIRRIETFGKFGYDFHIHNLNCVWIQGLEQYSRGWRTQTWYHLLNLIHSAYGLQHKASVFFFFFLFLWVLYLHSRRLAALGWEIASSRSKVIFLFDFPLLYVYSFYSLVCRVLEETSAMLLEIP